MQHMWKYLFGLAALVASSAMLIDSLSSAHAINGSQISLGSNPIANFYANCNGQNQLVVFQNSSAHDFVVTDIVIYNGAVRLNIGSSSSTAATKFIGGYASYGYDQNFRFNSGLVVPAGENIYCTDTNAYPEITISGYYTH